MATSLLDQPTAEGKQRIIQLARLGIGEVLEVRLGCWTFQPFVLLPAWVDYSVGNIGLRCQAAACKIEAR